MELEINDIGVIKHFEIELPDDKDGGVCVLVGANGTGKTTALDCVDAMTTANTKLVPRDTAKKGSVEGLGGSLNVTASRNTRSGEVEVPSLAGRFELDDLVTP